MRIFVTGATGWIGSAVVDELLSNGHEVVGLARSDASAALLKAKGARPQRGDLDDLDSIRAGAENADAVIHLANKHDFTNPAVSNRAERDAVETIGNALAESHRPLLIASGVTGIAPGRIITEHDRSPFHGPDSPRGGSENLALEYVELGVDTRIVRFAPTVHGDGDPGFMAALVAVARDKGASAYIGGGSSRWAAIHRNDAARVVRLGLERALEPGTVLHAVAETGVTAREIAEAIGRGLNVPVVSVPADDAGDHFGWLAMFYGTDIAARSDITQANLAWTPSEPTLVEDLDSGPYFRVHRAA
jgi:nucleoside-diphosphate-sugar epimerase